MCGPWNNNNNSYSRHNATSYFSLKRSLILIKIQSKDVVWIEPPSSPNTATTCALFVQHINLMLCESNRNLYIYIYMCVFVCVCCYELIWKQEAPAYCCKRNTFEIYKRPHLRSFPINLALTQISTFCLVTITVTRVWHTNPSYSIYHMFGVSPTRTSTIGSSSLLHLFHMVYSFGPSYLPKTDICHGIEIHIMYGLVLWSGCWDCSSVCNVAMIIARETCVMVDEERIYHWIDMFITYM